jgi:hypothetical protein
LLARPTNGLPETLGKERQRLAKVKSKKPGISSIPVRLEAERLKGESCEKQMKPRPLE